MKYVAIETFTDLQDNNHRYLPGDNFPRKGLEVSDSRLQELLTNKNRRERPMIKAIDEPKEEVIEEKPKKTTTKKAST